MSWPDLSSAKCLLIDPSKTNLLGIEDYKSSMGFNNGQSRSVIQYFILHSYDDPDNLVNKRMMAFFGKSSFAKKYDKESCSQLSQQPKNDGEFVKYKGFKCRGVMVCTECAYVVGASTKTPIGKLKNTNRPCDRYVREALTHNAVKCKGTQNYQVCDQRVSFYSVCYRRVLLWSSLCHRASLACRLHSQ